MVYMGVGLLYFYQIEGRQVRTIVPGTYRVVPSEELHRLVAEQSTPGEGCPLCGRVGAGQGDRSGGLTHSFSW